MQLRALSYFCSFWRVVEAKRPVDQTRRQSTCGKGHADNRGGHVRVQGSVLRFRCDPGEGAPTLTINVTVERDETSESIEFLIIGEEYFGASIMNLGSGWEGSQGPVDGPLVRIEGAKLTASATFVDGTDQVVGDGLLAASCDSAS